MHFMIFNLSFWVFEKVLGFFKIDEVIVKFLGWILWKSFNLFMHCIPCALSLYFHAFRCVLYMLNWLCAGRFELGWAHNDITVAHHMLMHFHAFVYLNCLGTFSSVSFFLLHSLVYVSASRHQNVSLLHLETLFIPAHLHFLILPPSSV